MSTILNALRRLEEEQKSQRELDEQGARQQLVTASGPPRRRRLRGLMVGLIGLLLTVALGAATTLGVLRYLDEPETLAGVPAAAPAATPDALAPTLPTEIGTPAANTTAPVASKPAPMEPMRVAAAVEEPEFLPEEPELAPRREPRSVAPPPARTPTSSEIVMVERRARPEPSVSAGPLDASPSRSAPEARRIDGDELVVARATQPSIPTEVRSPVPEVLVKRTIWHPDGTRREAVVEVRSGGDARTIRMREGQTLGSLELAEIRPSSVTFIHDGVELTRRVGARP